MQPKLQWQELEGGEWAAIVAGYALLATPTGAVKEKDRFHWRVEAHAISKETDTEDSLYGQNSLTSEATANEGFAPSLLAAQANAELAARRLLAADRKNIRLIAGSPARGKEK